MSLFARKNGREKSEQIWVVPEMKNIGKYTADEQRQFMLELTEAKTDLLKIRFDLEALEHSFNRQSEELKKLREAAGDRKSEEILSDAYAEICMLRKRLDNAETRMDVHDDMMALFNSGGRRALFDSKIKGAYFDVNKGGTIEMRIQQFLNKA